MKHITKLQKELIVWMVFMLFIAVVSGYYIEHIPNEHPGIIRLHIIANSDTYADQRLKLEVRDAILESMESNDSEDKTRTYIKGHLVQFEKIAENVGRKNGFNYKVRAKLRVTFIPEKSYDDLTLPAGNYEALNIIIGSGKGQNWWCVVYPQLCLVGRKSGDKLILKSKIKEIMKERVK